MRHKGVSSPRAEGEVVRGGHGRGEGRHHPAAVGGHAHYFVVQVHGAAREERHVAVVDASTAGVMRSLHAAIWVNLVVFFFLGGGLKSIFKKMALHPTLPAISPNFERLHALRTLC